MEAFSIFNALIFASVLHNISLEVYPLLISPNNDGLADSLYIQCFVPDSIACTNWNLSIWDSNDSLVYNWQDVDNPPLLLAWDGTNQDKLQLPDGAYSLNLQILTANNEILYAPLHWFGINAAPPLISLKTKDNIFSPNGDGVKDSVEISITFIGEFKAQYEVTLLDINYLAKRKWIGTTPPPSAIQWDGTGTDGAFLSDDEYFFQITVYHRGNYRYDSPLVPITLRTNPPQLTLQPKEYTAFSPNNDGIQDKLPLYLFSNQPLNSISMIIQDTLNTKFEIKFDELPDLYFWDGTYNDVTLPDGSYQLNLYGCDAVNNCSSSIPVKVTLDTSAPDPINYWQLVVWKQNDSYRLEINWETSLEDSLLNINLAADNITKLRPQSPIIVTHPSPADALQLTLTKMDAAGNLLIQELTNSTLNLILDNKTDYLIFWSANQADLLVPQDIKTKINRLCSQLVGQYNYRIICGGICPDENYMDGVRCGADLAGKSLMSLLETNKLDARKIRAIGDNKDNLYIMYIKVAHE